MTQEIIYTQEQAKALHHIVAKLLSFQEIFREDMVQDAIAQCEPFAEIAWSVVYINANKLLNEIEAQSQNTPPPVSPASAAAEADSVPLAGTGEWAIRVEDGHYFVHSTKTDECIACFDGKDSKAMGWAIRTRDNANAAHAASPANGDAATGSVGDGNGE